MSTQPAAISFFSACPKSVCQCVLKHALSFMSQCNRGQPEEPSTRLLLLTHTLCDDWWRPESFTTGSTCIYRFPSRNISKLQNEKTSAELTQTASTTLVQVGSWKPHADQGISVSSGIQLKISRNSCGKDSACHNLWAVVLRPEVHMPTSGPERQSCLGISPLNQKISFSVGRKPPFCHSTLLK